MPERASASDGSQRPFEKIRVSTDEAKDLSGETVAVVVGPQKEVFHIHETLLRASSPFVNKAMGPLWRESKERRINLPDDDPVIDGIFERYHTDPRDGKRWNVWPGAVDYAFEKTYKGAPIRRLFVDMYCLWSKNDILATWKAEEDIPHAFLVEAVRTLAKRPFSCVSLLPTNYYTYE